ncbi:MAG: LysM peptidoglycan-binding domain-containing protein [Gammaproteobacteria bacterium]|nr:LysM peptidoglycan-binding domain-containing protein [Gammaproteobacteria bacterium]MBL6999525.1 LysM peptidoglycan-binding domain-containing protein [Gammaproteobacteria bacterium]
MTMDSASTELSSQQPLSTLSNVELVSSAGEPISPEPVIIAANSLPLLEQTADDIVQISDVVNVPIESEVDLSLAGDENALLVDEIIHQAEIALSHQNNAWDRLQQGMRMNSVINSRVQAQLDWYLDHREYLDRVMKRAEPILPYILDVLEEKELPAELALLPIVESAYQTFAYSHGRASGMWQIIPSTGRHLGLKQNWWYDGRRDIIESTLAATEYLQSLAGQFDNDWELALASYNAGPGKIRSAIRYNKSKGRGEDFWQLTKIQPETKDYVPKLLALKELFSNPEKYQLELLPIEDELSYEVVEMDSQIDLALAAELADISTKELYQINPAFNRWATAPNGPHRLLLPKEKTELFKLNLAELPKNKRINWVRYKIKNGDTLSEIANRYRTTTTLIKNVNDISNSQIRAGKYLLIPTATQSLSAYTLSEGSRLKKIKNTAHKGEKVTYTVKSGDSFWTISRKYDVSTRSLAKWNGMAPIDTLKIGQELVIWQTPKTEAKALNVSLFASPQHQLHALRYTVRKGDSLSRIADKFNLNVADIKKWNNIGKYLQPGQKLKLYVDITRQSG